MLASRFLFVDADIKRARNFADRLERGFVAGLVTLQLRQMHTGSISNALIEQAF